MNLKKTFMALALSCFGAVVQTEAQPVVMTTPEGYNVLNISANGKWACGSYVDYADNAYGFRWNLESGKIELLSTNEVSSASDIADDGTVSGTFMDKECSLSGAAIEAPGYYRDGQWHHIEMPAGVVDDGVGHGISPDGHYMVGMVHVDGLYRPYIWKDGKIYRDLLVEAQQADAYAVSPDGQAATGWQYAIDPVTGKISNRKAVYWKPDGTYEYLSEHESPWSFGRNFSPDGSKLLYYGSWVNETSNAIYCIYDIATGTKKSLEAFSVREPELEFNDIANDGTTVGTIGEFMGISHGCIYSPDGQGQFIDTWLTSLGYDVSQLDIMPNNDGTYLINSATAISGDGRVVSALYLSKIGEMKSIIILADGGTAKAPTEVTAKQLPGIGAVSVTWNAPVGATGITGYNIYRNGTKLNAEPTNVLKYYDRNLAYGEYTYTVGAIYSDGTDEQMSSEAKVTVAPQSLQQPQGLFLRQKGMNSIYAQWDAPASNLITRNYYDIASANAEGFGVGVDGLKFEVGINFDKDDMANYEGCSIREVSFYPMSEQGAWTLNIYTRTAEGTLTRIASQPITQQLTYLERNTVTLTTPLALPEGDLIVAIETTVNNATNNIVGMDYGRYTPGYSDLLRQSTEDDFYSLYDVSSTSGNPFFVTWMIDVVLAPEGAKAEEVKSYTVYANGNKVGETTSQAYTLSGLTDGMHTVSVDAVYDSGTSAKTEKSLTVTTYYKPVDKVIADSEGDTKLLAFWAPPVDDDETTICYATGNIKSGPKGPASNNYGLMAGVKYMPSMLKGYDGYQVKSLSFYPIADAFYTFYLLENDKQILELEVDDYELNKWNTVTLPEPVTINARSIYQISLDCYDVTPQNTAPLAIDDTPAYESISNLVSITDGESWEPFSTSGLKGNWWIGWTMTAGDAKEVAVDGYDVCVDGKKLNDSRITENVFRHDFGTNDGMEHQLSVDVYYPAMTESVKGKAVTFHIGVTGINKATVAVLNMHSSNGYLHIDGEGIEAVAAYSMSGANVASAKGNTLDISGLATGVYVVKVTANGKDITRKIEIRK